MTLEAAPAKTVVDLWAYFDDAEDGPALTYAVGAGSITNGAVLAGTPAIDADGYLQLQAGASGTTEIGICATDSGGASVSATFIVETLAPTVSIVDVKHTGETAPVGYFVVRLSGPSSVPVQMTYKLTGEAVFGDDYQLNISDATGTPGTTGVLDFAVGQSEIKLMIQPVDDAAVEGDAGHAETVTLTLSVPVAADLATASADLHLNDDDNGAVVYVAHVQSTSENLPEGAVGAVTLESIGRSLAFYTMTGSYRWPTVRRLAASGRMMTPGIWYPTPPPATATSEVHFSLPPGGSVTSGAAAQGSDGNWVAAIGQGGVGEDSDHAERRHGGVQLRSSVAFSVVRARDGQRRPALRPDGACVGSVIEGSYTVGRQSRHCHD